jgi:hypothetical protein
MQAGFGSTPPRTWLMQNDDPNEQDGQPPRPKDSGSGQPKDAIADRETRQQVAADMTRAEGDVRFDTEETYDDPAQDTFDVPSPDYKWGGYTTTDVFTETGYISPEGYGPYASPDAAAAGRPAERHQTDVARSNFALGEDVRLALLQEGRLSRSRLALEVAQGIVTLIGTVPSEYLRSLAQRTAEAVPGVLVVHNRLDVAEIGPEPEVHEVKP